MRPDDPVTGIVPHVLETVIERGDPSVFVAAARVADLTAYGLPWKSASEGSGAGLTAAAARGAAVGEAVERYACAIVHPEDLVFGSTAALRRRGLPVIGPERWALYHPSQAPGLPFPVFDDDAELAWVRVESLTHQAERLVPASLVYLPYEETCGDREVVISPSLSTGAACAASRREALLKGVCELIERDAFMITWHNRLARPRVRIDEASPLFRVFTERFARHGLDYRIYDCTLDLGVPSFFGVLHAGLRTPGGFSVGGAAHPDPEVAVLKTLLELVQGLKWMDHLGPSAAIAPTPGFGHIHDFEHRARLYGFSEAMAPALGFLDGGGEIKLSEIARPPTGSADDILEALVPRLAAAGLEVLGIDLTPVDVAACGLSVVRALLPGCEMMEGDHRAQFLGGTRWRDVPVQLGLRDAPLALDAINPDPHPYP